MLALATMDEMDELVIQLIVQLTIGLVFGIVCAVLAPKRGRSAVGWFFFGFFFNCIGIIVLMLIPDLKVEASAIAVASKRHGACASSSRRSGRCRTSGTMRCRDGSPPTTGRLGSTRLLPHRSSRPPRHRRYRWCERLPRPSPSTGTLPAARSASVR